MKANELKRIEPISVSVMRVVSVTLFTAVCSLVVTVAYILVYPLPESVTRQLMMPTILISAVLPLLMTPPIALTFQRKRLNLAEAHRQLQLVNEGTRSPGPDRSADRASQPAWFPGSRR
jgi:hypothetical protein